MTEVWTAPHSRDYTGNYGRGSLRPASQQTAPPTARIPPRPTSQSQPASSRPPSQHTHRPPSRHRAERRRLVDTSHLPISPLLQPPPPPSCACSRPAPPLPPLPRPSAHTHPAQCPPFAARRPRSTGPRFTRLALTRVRFESCPGVNVSRRLCCSVSCNSDDMTCLGLGPLHPAWGRMTVMRTLDALLTTPRRDRYRAPGLPCAQHCRVEQERRRQGLDPRA